MVTYIQVNIVSGSGLLPDDTITWTNVDFLFVRLCGIHLRAISQWVSMLLFCMMSFKIIVSKLLPHLPGAIGLTRWSPEKMTDNLETYQWFSTRLW